MNKVKDSLSKLIIFACALASVLLLSFLAYTIFSGSVPALNEFGFQMFRFSEPWRPTNSPPNFGLIPAILGSLYVSSLAVLIALVLGLGASIFIEFYLPKRLKQLALSLMDMLAGIPSVIFGFLGLIILVRFFTYRLSFASGHSILGGGLVLGVLLLPFIISTCVESLSHYSSLYKLPAIGLGIDKETFIYKIVLRSMGKPILLASVIAFGRAIGETMAVMMVIGNSPILPKLLGRGQTIPSLTALEMGNVAYGSIHLSALYVANAVLFLILVGVLLLAAYLSRRLDKDEG